SACFRLPSSHLRFRFPPSQTPVASLPNRELKNERGNPAAAGKKTTNFRQACWTLYHQRADIRGDSFQDRVEAVMSRDAKKTLGGLVGAALAGGLLCFPSYFHFVDWPIMSGGRLGYLLLGEV